MNWIDPQERPTKKRRFFSNSGDDEKASILRPPLTAPKHELPVVDDVPEDGSHRPTDDENVSPTTTFDKGTFEAFVGDKVNIDTLDVIRTHCSDNMEKAVNMYLDGTWKNLKKPKLVNSSSTSSSISAAPEALLSTLSPMPIRLPPSSSPNHTHTARKTGTETSKTPRHGPAADFMPESRYIGAFGVEGWAIRSGTNLIKHGDRVQIERHKIQPLMKRNRLGSSPAMPRNGRPDIIVRFTDSKGAEIGRLAKESASWVSALIDSKVCRFEGTCVYAPERMRTNDTVFLQLTCSLLRSAFQADPDKLAANRNVSIFESNETMEERGLRLRQVALVKLFQEINLMPTRAAAKHNRQGLLDAADSAELKEDASKNSQNGQHGQSDPPVSSPPSDDVEDGQELEQDQVDALYRKAQSFDFSTPEAEPADTFAMTLRPYQKQSLHWMLSKERDMKDEAREASMHPLWEEYTWPTQDFDEKDVLQVEGQSAFYVNPYSGEMSLEFPKQEQHCLGGMLADEMGLGKTIQMLSLIHTHKMACPNRQTSEAQAQAQAPPPAPAPLQRQLQMPNRSAYQPSRSRTTLVIAPMSLLAQWHGEAENASREGTLKSMVYYGNEKNIDLQALCSEANPAAPDVVVTSYGVVLSEFSSISRNNGSRATYRGVFSLNFFRIILDEAHTIKNRQSKTAKACYELSAEHRWVLTGTPIVNRLEDLFSLVRFLRVEPWNNFSFWRTFITLPFESKDMIRALDVVQTVLEPLVIRRTKDMKTPDGQPLVVLPPKSIEFIDVELSEQERCVYDHIFTRARQTFSANVEKGTVMKAYTTIFAQILRLRQSCCHPVLVRSHDVAIADEEGDTGANADAAGTATTILADDMDLQALIQQFTASTDDEKESKTFETHVLEQIRDEADDECPICSEEPMIERTVTGCWHSACKKCLLDFMKHHTDRHEVPKCFNCREPLDSRDLFEVIRHDDCLDDHHDPSSASGPSFAPKISLQRLGVNHSSSKVVALIQHLRQLRQDHPRIKSIVFSQFTSFLTLIEQALQRANMTHLRLDGILPQKARAAVLNEFQSSNKFTVLLISLRAGGVGLNLTQAKRVFMMDPWWSFAVEAQAIDRVHRMGQEDEVKVYRFITRNSVEERMLKVQDRKKFIASSLGMMSDEEKKLRRIDDIKELLS